MNTTITPCNNNNNNKNNNNKPRRKRRWYHSSRQPEYDISVNKMANQSNTPPPKDMRQERLKQHEKDRAENSKQVNKMEQQLHEYFHKTNTPYSYIDDKGIFNFTPVPPPPPASETNKQTTTTATATATTSTQQQQQQQGTTPINPFMNMTFNPFVPSNSLFSTPFPTLWTSIFPIKMVETKTGGVSGGPHSSTGFNPNNAATSPSQPENIETINICEKIDHINDLIALCDKYPLAEDKKYNINMSAIHAIREPLTDLSNMVGMETIKRTIVDQILYYLQELHIPETKHKAPMDESATYKTEEKKPIFNPFAPAFPGVPGVPGHLFESTNAAFPPFNSKKNTWSNVYCNVTNTDDFALPTKGDFMHTVIYGPPGSGKTEVAKIIGRIFSNLGILNKKIFKKVSRNDLVAGYLGQTAIKTKDMIKASLGGVLFIDEAYSLGNSEKRDSFAKECVDTLCEALSEHKHNWMVIIAGYEKELNDCFFSLNEGLNSRFTWRFKLDAYKPCELKSIYAKQVRDYGWSLAMRKEADADADADVIPESWFASRMDYFTTFGRDMETLFTKTKIAHSRRVFCLPMCEKKIVTFADLENGFKLFIENPEVSERKEKSGGGPYMKTLYL
jgi:hypothetical protein